VDAQPVKSNLLQYAPLVFQGITAASVIYGLVTIPIEIGRKDQILMQQQKSTDELHAVVSDLVKTTINLTGTDRVHDRDLNELRSRLEKLESKRG
jgi:hypothetical protein